MPKFQINANGKKYVITAPDQASAMAAFQKFAGQAQPKAPPVPAATTAGAQPNPQESSLPGVAGQLQNTSRAFQSGAMQGMTLGFGDEINAGLMTPIEMGIDAFQGKSFDPGRSFNQALDKNRKLDQANADLNPFANVTGEISGGFAGPAKGLGLLRGAKTALGVAGRGIAEGAAMGGAYGFGSSDGNINDRLQGAAKGAAFGGAMGGIVPALAKKGGDIVESVLQNKATSKAIANAPSAAELKAASSALFQNVDKSGVTVDTGKFGQLVQTLAGAAKKDRINPTLDPKAFAAYQELINALGDVQANGGALTISDIHTLRQIAQRAAVSTEGRDAMFANRIVDGLDNFIKQPGTLKLPANQIGKASGNAANDLFKAISTWGQSRRVGLIEQAMEKAKSYPSGLESGLRAQFKSLLNNKATSKLWTAAERQAMQKVINGSLPVTALRTLGIFKGLGGASLGFTFGGPWGAAIGGAAGMLGKKVTEKATEAAANRAAQVVATPNIPIVRLPNFPRIAGGPVALPLIDRQR